MTKFWIKMRESTETNLHIFVVHPNQYSHQWILDETPYTVMTTKAPVVLKKQEIFNPKANISASANQWTTNMLFSFSFWIFSNRVDDGFEETLSAEVWIVEHSTIRQTFVNGKRLSTRFVTKWRKRKVDLDILLQTFLLDRFHQFELMWPCVGNNQDDSVVGHFVQGEVNS